MKNSQENITRLVKGAVLAAEAGVLVALGTGAPQEASAQAACKVGFLAIKYGYADTSSIRVGEIDPQDLLVRGRLDPGSVSIYLGGLTDRNQFASSRQIASGNLEIPAENTDHARKLFPKIEAPCNTKTAEGKDGLLISAVYSTNPDQTPRQVTITNGAVGSWYEGDRLINSELINRVLQDPNFSPVTAAQRTDQIFQELFKRNPGNANGNSVTREQARQALEEYKTKLQSQPASAPRSRISPNQAPPQSTNSPVSVTPTSRPAASPEASATPKPATETPSPTAKAEGGLAATATAVTEHISATATAIATVNTNKSESQKLLGFLKNPVFDAIADHWILSSIGAVSLFYIAGIERRRRENLGLKHTMWAGKKRIFW